MREGAGKGKDKGDKERCWKISGRRRRKLRKNGRLWERYGRRERKKKVDKKKKDAGWLLGLAGSR